MTLIKCWRQTSAAWTRAAAHHLVSVVDVAVRQSPRHQLKQDHSISVHIRLERVGVAVLHSDHLGSLRKRKQWLVSYSGPVKVRSWQIKFLSFKSTVWPASMFWPKLSIINVQVVKDFWFDGLTIHRMEPLGCSTCWEPLHRDFTVAKPKSPIFTVQPSWRKISSRTAQDTVQRQSGGQFHSLSCPKSSRGEREGAEHCRLRQWSTSAPPKADISMSPNGHLGKSNYILGN